ncbi:hypothetical protein QLH51_12900 [Sphingomonas sp. 2R-10]|uniref:hypothetical protein n=1 Tax=Sphingomonas sp. 2R-10 TaxID=3045148 RepID=UPI000F7828E5|nr:hypothetical protein [Sphingomonas sp. 2R-10]MDJ0277696.1 hypothetical protein [Sphingomonas sp. 2R-10]
MFEASLSVLIVALASAHSAQRPPDRSSTAEADTTDIIVTGRRRRTGVTDRYSEASIRTLGAMTIGEVIARLERRNGGRPFSIIVNGRRIADISDLREIPPEALAEIEVLANDRAGTFGFPADRQVLNLVLKERFASITGDAAVRVPTEGGGYGGTSAIRSANIHHERRFNIVASLQGSAALKGSERRHLLEDEQDGALARYRTLVPSNRSLSVTSGLALPLGAVSLNVSGSVSDTLSLQQSRFYRVPSVPRDSGEVVSGAIDISRSRSIVTGVSASGVFGRTNWTAEITGSVISNRVRSRASDRAISLAQRDVRASVLPGTYSPLASSSDSTNLDFSVMATRSLVSLPAGEINANMRIGGGRQTVAASNTADRAERRQRFAQGRTRWHGGVDVPLIGPAMPGWGKLGTVSLSINGDVERVGGSSANPGYDTAVTWQPVDALSISLSRNRTGIIPDLSRRRDPVVYSDGTLVIDARTGGYAIVTRIAGGTPDLQRTSQIDTVARIGANTSRDTLNLSATAEYASARIINPIVPVAYPSAFFQQVFPDRFSRDDRGALTVIDTRPFNAADERRDVLRANLHISSTGRGHASTAGSEERRNAVEWDFSLGYEWTMKDVLRPFGGVGSIDLLRTPLDGIQGTPRHKLNMEASAARKNITMQLSSRWRSGARVDNLTATERSGIIYAAFWTTDAEVTITLDQDQSADSVKGSTRLWLSVENVFNRRLSVVDLQGTTPPAFRPVFLDPIGRIVSVRLSTPF